jgi:hypothetical protein
MKTNSMASPNHKTIHAAFHSIWTAWLEMTCELFPEQGSKLGLRKYDARLGENTPGIHLTHIKLLEKTLRQIEDLPESAFQGDLWLDRRGLISRLRTDLLFQRDLRRWRTNPQDHSNAAIDSVFELVVRGENSLRRVLPAIEARLAAIPDFLAAGLDCIKSPDPLWTSLAIQSCAGSIEFLRGLEKDLEAASTRPVKIKALLEAAVRAFNSFSKGVTRKPEGPKGSFAIGRERFEFLIREQLGLDLTLAEARAVGLYQIARHEHLLAQAAKRHGKKSARSLIQEAAEQWRPDKPLIDLYLEETSAIKMRLERIGLVTLPANERLKVLPVPPFLKHQFPTAAYSAPEPFSKSHTGIFWVNDLGLDQSDPRRKAAEIRQHHGLELTCVHEAYPGHHLQFVTQFRHSSRLRRLFSHAIFYEGWTMWSELNAVRHNLVNIPCAELIQLHDALWRAHRIVIDCGLHDGTLNHSAAVKQLQKGVHFTASRAAGDVNWYTSSPTVPMSYLLGRLEVEKLHRRLVEQGSWTLKRFNDWMLSHGALPFSWIQRA